jgi:hypothetical protein
MMFAHAADRAGGHGGMQTSAKNTNSQKLMENVLI